MDEKGDYDHTGPIATQQSWRLIVDRSNTEHGQLRSEIGRSSTDHGLQRTDFEMARFQGLRTDTIPPKKELSLSGTELAKEEPVQFEHEIHSKEYEKAANRLVPEHPQALLPPEQGLFDSDKDTVNVQAPIVLESDRSLQSALGRIFGDTEIVESSRSPFPESYTELIVDQSSGNRIGFDLGGVLAQGDAPRGEGEGPFHPSPEYSNKLAEALSLSCQEGGQKLSENDDLPPLISWLPVNISETASTPKSPLGKPKPMTPQLLDSHQHFFSDQNNNLGNIGANNSNIANPRHFEENLGLNLSQSLEHQIGSCRSLTPPPPYLHQEAFEMLHSSQKSLSRPPSLETVYSKYSPDSSRGNSSLGASLKSDSLCTPNSGNSLSTPLGNNSFGTSFPGNTSDTSSHFIPSNSNIQSAPLDVSFIKQEPEDDYWSTSLTSETISHPVETVNPNALEDTSLHWPRHFMDAFLEAKQNRNPCIRNMHDEDSPMFTPEHKLDDDENLGLSRIPHLEKSLNNPRYEAEAAGRSPIYGPIAGQAEDIYRQAKDIGNLAETVCELLESDQMDLDDLIDIKGEPEVVNRLYSEYQEELKGNHFMILSVLNQ